MAEQGATFAEFVQGGLLDDADVLVKGSRFTTWDYNGKQPQPVLAVKLTMEDGEANDHEQYLSSGELRFFVPSADGRLAVPVGSQKSLNINTNAVAFILSVLNAAGGDPVWAAKFRDTGDVSLLEGMRMHVIRKAQPKRTGLIQAPGTEGQPQREKTQLLCERIISYPGQAAPAAGTKATAPAAPAAAAAPAVAGGELDDTTVGVLLRLLSENGNTLKVSAIAGKFFGAAAFKDGGDSALTAPQRNAVLGLIVKPDFLGAEGRPWAYDKAASTVSLG